MLDPAPSVRARLMSEGPQMIEAAPPVGYIDSTSAVSIGPMQHPHQCAVQHQASAATTLQQCSDRASTPVQRHSRAAYAKYVANTTADAALMARGSGMHYRLSSLHHRQYVIFLGVLSNKPCKADIFVRIAPRK